jgi:hypothetical protein
MTATSTDTARTIRLALDDDRSVAAIVHDDRGQRRDGTIDHVYADDVFGFTSDDGAYSAYIAPRDLVEYTLVD